MSRIISPEAEVRSPKLATIRQINQHGSRIFPGHLTKDNIIVVDYPVERMLSWHHHEIRRRIGKASIGHLALLPELSDVGVRLLGLPVDKSDRVIEPRLQVDLRMQINTHNVDTSLPQRELCVVPDWLAREVKHGVEVKFEQPEDLPEQLEARFKNLANFGFHA